MWISLEPISGEWLDAYPEYASSLINDSELNTSIYLGADCFNATIIKKKDDWCLQSTSGISTINKKPGFRDVGFITIDTVTVYFNSAGGRWTFLQPSHYARSKILNVEERTRYPGTNLTWQWSVNTSFHHSQEKDWISYCTENVQKIEDAFSNSSRDIIIDVGMKKYKINFILDDMGNKSVFALQTCTQTGNRRCARRCFKNETLFFPPGTEDTCSLCMELFEDTKHLPWVKTSCNHFFHAVCLDRVKHSSMNSDRCPLCRSAF